MGTEHHSKPGSARFTVALVRGLGYAVFDPTGRLVSEHSPFRGQTERLRDELQRAQDQLAKRGPRACMCCGSEFKSDGIHHRMCNTCRARGEADQPVRPAIPARRSA